MLCGPVGPKLKSLLPEDILVPEKCQMAVDENHVILEYGKNDKWGEIEAPVANRFIMSHDVANSAMSTLESFIGQCYDLFNVRTRVAQPITSWCQQSWTMLCCQLWSVNNVVLSTEQCCAAPSKQYCSQGCSAMITMLLQHCSAINTVTTC